MVNTARFLETHRVTLTSSKSKIPSATSTSIQPAGIKVRLSEEVERCSRIDNGKIGIQDTSPSASDIACRVNGSVSEVSVPLLGDELLGAGEG